MRRGGFTERVCSNCDATPSIIAATRLSTAAGIVVRVTGSLLDVHDTKIAVWMAANHP